MTGQQIKAEYWGVNGTDYNRLSFYSLSTIREKKVGSSLLSGLKALLENRVLYLVAGGEILSYILVFLSLSKFM